MSVVNVVEIKAKLSEYLDRVAKGERIVIYRHHTPVAELRAVESARTEPRPIGPLPGETAFDVPPSFFEPLSDEELDLWDGIGELDPLGRPPSSKVAEDKGGYSAPGRRRPRVRRS